MKTHFMSNNIFSRKLCRLLDNVVGNGIAGQARDDNKAHAHCLLDS